MSEQMDMRQIRIDTHTAATVRCVLGDFSENAPDDATVGTVLSHGAMHAISAGPGHRVFEHVDRDMTVDSL